MNTKLDLSTKLRLENSALGSYEGTADDNGISFKIPKNLKPENLIGTIVHIIVNDDGHELDMYLSINSVNVSSDYMTCGLGGDIGSITYLSETGYASLTLSL